jgi:hypothetical protein
MSIDNDTSIPHDEGFGDYQIKPETLAAFESLVAKASDEEREAILSLFVDPSEFMFDAAERLERKSQLAARSGNQILSYTIYGQAEGFGAASGYLAYIGRVLYARIIGSMLEVPSSEPIATDTFDKPLEKKRTPFEDLAIIKDLDLELDELSNLICVGTKTVKNWANGHSTPSKGSSIFLRDRANMVIKLKHEFGLDSPQIAGLLRTTASDNSGYQRSLIDWIAHGHSKLVTDSIAQYLTDHDLTGQNTNKEDVNITGLYKKVHN